MDITLFAIHLDDATLGPTSILGDDESDATAPVAAPETDAEPVAERGDGRRTGRAVLSAVAVVAVVGAGLVAIRRFRTRDAALDEDHEEIEIDTTDDDVRHADELEN